MASCTAPILAANPGQPPAQNYYLPLGEDILYSHYASMGQTTASNIVYIVSISVAVSNTVIYFDPCADGYEKDISNPTQSTTQVWGDGNPANGMPPGYTNDVLNAGSVIVLQTTNIYPRVSSTTGYHAGDRLASTKPISMTVVAWPTSTGPLLGEGCEVYDTSIYGNTFVAPVGTNVIDSVQYPMFDSSMFEVLASQDGTVVRVDQDGDGLYEVTNTLNRGQEFYMTNVVAGARISASLPVEVQLLTAQKNSNYANRWYTLYPKEVWSSDYYTPVNTTSSTYPAACYLYNDQSTQLAVTCVTASGSTVTNVPANRCVRYDMPATNTGARFYTSNSVPFEAVTAVCESFADPNHGSTYDWGASLLPAPLLSTVNIIGYGAGSDNGTANGSPVWAMAISNTTLYVDFYPTSTVSGAHIDPYGNHYDTNMAVTAFQPVRIFNPTVNSQTGLRVYTLDGTKIVCMWGEDPATAGTAEPYIDAGTSEFPIPTFSVVKASQLIYDANTNGAYDVGDRIRYTIYMNNAGMRPLTNLWLNDPLPANVTYYPGSTLVDGVAVADDAVPPNATAYPLDEGGRYLGTIPPGISRVVSFDVTIVNPLPSGVTNILNVASASVQGYQASATNNVDLGAEATVSGWVLTDQNGNGVADAGDTNGINGVVLRLLNASSNVVATTTSTVSGAYIFTNIAPGSYTVVQTLPAGYTNTLDASGPNDLCIPVTLTVGRASTGNNFYDTAFANLGDFTWLDVNRNGQQDAGEPGLAGVVVYLYNTNNAIVATTTSSLAGAYAFTGILPGTYTVGFTPPTGFLCTTSNVGSDVTDSDPLPGTNRTAAITLTSGQTNNDIDAGFYLGAYVPIRLGDFTWVDANGNGVQDAGETGLVGVVVQLYDLTNALVATSTSTVAGAYAFTNVAPGTYTLAFTPPAGYLFTTSNVGSDATDSDPLPGTNRTAAVTIGGGQTNNNIDAGFYPAASVAGYVRVDTNGNGVVDGGETNGIAGVTVQLLDAASNVVASTTTANDGSYAFTGLRAGSYTVRETDQPGWYSTTDTQGPNDNLIAVTLAIGQFSTGNSFYDTAYGTIGDFTWVDSNGNGVQDGGEPGLQNVVVRLYNTNNAVIATTTSSVAGAYAFTGLAAGAYTVSFTPPAGYLFTTSNVGSDTTDSDPLPGTNRTATIVLISGQTNNNVDAGFDQATSVSGAVMLDNNGNGIVESADTNGIAGVTVQLLNASSNVVATTTTAASGAFAFTNILPGAYSIKETDLPGYISTTQNGGGTSNLIGVTVLSGTPATGNNFYDTALASIAGTVIADVNGNGVKDAADTNGIAGATVVLRNAASNVVASVVTTSNGAFNFTNLPPGAYTLIETNAGGWVSTGPTNDQLAVTVTSGQASAGNTFLDTQATSISGGVYLDVNGNGIVESADTNGIAGVTVQLLNASSNVVATTTTAASGAFAFTNILPGAYSIKETDLPGYISTTQNGGGTSNLIGVTVLSGTPATGNNFYDTALASIAGTVIADVNGNGVKDAADTNGIAGATVVLRNASSNVVASVVTTASGAFSFTNLPPGTYTLIETNASGWVSTGPTNDQLAVTVTSGQTSAGNTFLDTQATSVSGGVYLDVNGNGVVDAPDTNGIAGVTVQLLNAASNVVATTTTAATGGYSFTNILPGSYTVKETDLSGYLSTTQNGGGTSNLIGVVVTSGTPSTGNNFYDTAYASISGSVNVDVNGNGVKDAADTNGIAGATVVLRNASSNVVASVVTTASGAFSFTNLPPGSYTLIETNASGWVSTGPTNDQLAVTVTSGQASTGNTFLDAQAATVSGGVYLDVNGNGVVEAPDTNGIAGVTVQLLNATSNVVATTTTAASGGYSFTNILPGSYTVKETDLSGYLSTTQNGGGMSNQIGVAVTSGTPSTGNNFYDTAYASISGTVNIDVNGNGVKDAADTNGIAGATVVLLNAASNVVATVVTTTSGAFSFTNLPPGSYTLIETNASGWVSTGPTNDQLAVTVTSGQASTGNTFLDTQATSVSGGVYLDVNGNGIVDAPDTNGIAGVTVQLLNASSNVVATTTTAASGGYSFTNIRPGSYTVVQTLPVGYTNTLDTSAPNDLRIPVAPTSGTPSTSNNFYDTAYASIAGSVLIDVNGNGIADAGDTNGIAGVTVQLLDATNGVVATTTTAANGSYSFANVRPGSYTVRETDLPGWYSTLDSAPPNDNLIPLTVMSGQSSAGNTFYDTAYAAIGDFTWVDSNINGVQDGGEPGLSNVVVTLYNTNNTVIAATTSSVAGAYAFTGIPAGTYTVGFTPPTGYLFTTSNVGNDATDSDPLPGTNVTAAITLTSGQTNNNVDAGFYQLASVAGAVLIDVNGNGVADAGDTNGIAGVTVTLLNAASNIVATAITSATGAYSFTNLTPGAYTVVQALPTGYTNTLDTVPPNDLRIPATLASGQASTGNNFYDTPSGSVAARNKVLYLNDPSQSLNRIDPVAAGDNTTANTGLFGALAWDSTTSTNGSAASFTFSHTTGVGSNRLLLVGVSMQQAGQSVTNVTYGGTRLTRVGAQSNGTSGTGTRMEIWQLVNPPVGTANVVVTLSATSQAAMGAATFTGVDQTTPLGTFVSATGSSTAPGVTVAAAAGELVFDTMSSRNAAAATQNASQTLLWQDTTQANVTGGGSTKPGAASVTMSWTAGNSA